MKRGKPLNKIGRIGEANREARKRIAAICEEKNLNRCEVNLEGCLKKWPLAPAHRRQRAEYHGNVDMLSDYNEWVVACQHCHTELDRRTPASKQLTEEVFAKHRP